MLSRRRRGQFFAGVFSSGRVRACGFFVRGKSLWLRGAHWWGSVGIAAIVADIVVEASCIAAIFNTPSVDKLDSVCVRVCVHFVGLVQVLEFGRDVEVRLSGNGRWLTALGVGVGLAESSRERVVGGHFPAIVSIGMNKQRR